MQHKNLTVCKANKVIEAGYKLSLNEQRVVLACISQVNSVEELFKTDRFELSAKDFAKLIWYFGRQGLINRIDRVLPNNCFNAM